MMESHLVFVLLAGVAFVTLLGSRLLPSRNIRDISSGSQAETRDFFGLRGWLFAVRVPADSALVGKSLVEEDQLDQMKSLLADAGEKILLPCDHVATDDFASGKPTVIEDVSIPAGLLGMDIGPKTVAEFSAVIAEAKTLVWNGPMGVFENEAYAAGTRAIAEAVAKAAVYAALVFSMVALLTQNKAASSTDRPPAPAPWSMLATRWGLRSRAFWAARAAA